MKTIAFHDPIARDQARSGGKGANLAALTQTGFRVPDGFIVPVEAYRAFVEINSYAPVLAERIAACRPDDPDSLDAASREIRARFRAGRIPQSAEREIAAAYRALGEPPAAVRSSATAEDLPDLSFAGQQDTFLDVQGVDNLLRAIRECWGSLWTARAIGYRARNRIPAEGLALAVVVQRMVPSELSGVLFTANPLTGARGEIVIDAVPGLGEGLVSGQVEPDHYVIDSGSGAVTTMQYGLRSLDPLGAVLIRRDRPRLSEAQLQELADLGRRVAETQGSPQDLEWAFAGGMLHLLQARPITSLYPVPPEWRTGPLRLMFSFGAMQGMLDPITPAGMDALQCVACGLAGVLGFRVSPADQRILLAAGERLWINITPLYTHKLGRRVLMGILGYIDPAARLALAAFEHEERLGVRGSRPPLRLLAHAVLHIPPLGFRILRYLLRPDATLADANRRGDLLLETVRERCRSVGGSLGDLARRAALIREITARMPDAVPAFATGLASGMVSFNILRILAARWLPDMRKNIPRITLEATRGLPNNVTTQMDLALFAASRKIRADADGRLAFESRGADDLAAAYRRGSLPAAAQAALAEFLSVYGVRGLAEIDLGRERWREDPRPVIQSLQSYMTIEDGPLSPDRVFARGRTEAESALERLFAAVRVRRFGRVKERVLRFFAGRMRALMGIRESPKFLIIRMTGILREAVLDSGADLADKRILERAGDVFWLSLAEMQSLAQGRTEGWPPVIAARHAAFERELGRRRIPRLLLSTGEAVFESAPESEGDAVLRGDPVSPGMVEGRVRVVRDPRGARLEHGEILVCPGTDPSWTPLFLAAGGLVMEVGGMMTHGSVVAREYGIPAVVGVDRPTERLTTGMRVRVDGSRGTVEVVASD